MAPEEVRPKKTDPSRIYGCLVLGLIFACSLAWLGSWYLLDWWPPDFSRGRMEVVTLNVPDQNLYFRVTQEIDGDIGYAQGVWVSKDGLGWKNLTWISPDNPRMRPNETTLRFDPAKKILRLDTVWEKRGGAWSREFTVDDKWFDAPPSGTQQKNPAKAGSSD